MQPDHQPLLLLMLPNVPGDVVHWPLQTHASGVTLRSLLNTLDMEDPSSLPKRLAVRLESTGDTAGPQLLADLAAMLRRLQTQLDLWMPPEYWTGGEPEAAALPAVGGNLTIHTHGPLLPGSFVTVVVRALPAVRLVLHGRDPGRLPSTAAPDPRGPLRPAHLELVLHRERAAAEPGWTEKMARHLSYDVHPEAQDLWVCVDEMSFSHDPTERIVSRSALSPAAEWRTLVRAFPPEQGQDQWFQPGSLPVRTGPVITNAHAPRTYLSAPSTDGRLGIP